MNLNRSKVSIGIIFMILFFGINSTTLTAQSNPDKGTIEKKAKDLVSKMTLEEKIGMTVGDGRYLIDAEVEKINDVWIANRNSKMIIPRLSIRTTALTDGPSGINKSPAPEGAKDYTYTTAFPTSTCLAATWNTELVENVGKAFGNEVLEYDYDLVLMPALNIHRDPNGGRSFEYYSEDPLLSGKMASSIVNGITI